MGWKQTLKKRTASLVHALCALALLAFVTPNAQAAYIPPPGGGPGIYNHDPNQPFNIISDDQFITVGNSYLLLSVGQGKNQGGSLGIFTTQTNPTDPFDTLMFFGKLIPPTNIRLFGTRVFVRVDGGINGGRSGFDYEFGQPDRTRGGVWLTVPEQVGVHLVARWQTYPIAPIAGTGGGSGGTGGGGGGIGGGGGGGGTATTLIDPKIEIDMVASFVHNQIRFQFNIVNNDPGHSHTVGLAFLQDHLFDPNDFTLSAPIVIPNRPYIRTEVSLTGNDVPAYWLIQRPGQAFGVGGPGGGNTNTPTHTLRGQLRPTATSGNEPTIPSRYVLGRGRILEGSDPPIQNQNGGGVGGNLSIPAANGRYFDSIWNFVPDPKVRFDTAGSPDGAIETFYDEQPVAPGQSIPITAYIGQGDSESDIGTPIGLSVSAPTALPFSCTTPTSKFTVAAFVTNLLDLQPGAGISISPVSVTIDLPAGLKLAANDTATKTIASIAPGDEGGVTWVISSDGTATGTLKYTVTAAANVGTGKVVQRTIIVPTSPGVDLKGNVNARGLYQMVSFPLDFHADAVTKVLFPGQDPNLVTPDLAKYNSTTGKYETVTTFVLGQAYWIRSRIAQDQHVTLDCTTYPPLNNQVQPTNTAYKVTYNKGWNQIGNPYVYPINFSEAQIFDPDTLGITSVSDASSPVNQTILPAVYQYDTTDPNPSNWHYVLEDSIGFTMQPFVGYWLYLKKAGLQFLYPGVDIPGVSVGRAAMMGVGFNSRLKRSAAEKLGQNRIDNWKLKISAKSDNGYDPDNFIGVAPKATDGMDGYKYGKPPIMNNTLTMGIVHADWKDGGRLAHDLRSPMATTKTWDMEIQSGKPNDSVTLTWSNIAHDVPRGYRLTLIDSVTNQRINMRNAASHVVTTGPDGTRSVQIVAEPQGQKNKVQITSFNVISAGGATRATQSANIQFSLTRSAANVAVNVRNARGQVIRTLNNLSTRGAEGGVTTGTALWDLKNQQGTAVAAGQYNVELNVQTEDGQRARSIQPLVITR